MTDEAILRYTETDRELFIKTYAKRATLVFLYSSNVLFDGKIEKYENGARTVAYSGVLYAPTELFTRFAGAKITDETLIFDGNEYSYKEEKKTAKGVDYVPLEKACAALGISAKAYDSRLFVIANEDVLRTLSDDKTLLNSAMYAVTGEYKTAHLTSDDFTAIKDKWRTILVGNERINDTSDPEVVQKLEEISKNAKAQQERLNRNADRVILFGDEPPVESADLRKQYAAIWDMAQGYATYGAETYRDPGLRDDILDCLEWMYVNMYGDSIIEGRGWRDARAFNWWDWFVGGIIPLTRTMLVMEEFLSMEKKQNYLKCFKWIMTVHRVGYRSDFASSRIIVATPAALLLEDRELLYSEFLDYDLLLEEAGPERGKYADFVCWTHNYPYNMMYGFCAIDRTFFVGSVLSGTAAEFASPKEYGMYNLVKYMYEAACYKGQGFVIFNGRGNMGTEMSSGVTIITKVLPMIGCFGEDEDAYLKRMVKRLCSTPEIIQRAKRACSLYNLSVLCDILNDDSISSVNDYQLTYAWFTADRIAHHRDDYAFMLAMSSARHPSYESINSANKYGWRTGDGALYFYTDTDRYAFDGVNFITNPEITKRVPGTTADARDMQPWSYRSGWRSPKTYAGCMDLYGSFGVGAFEYSAYHYDGHEADGTSDGGYGGGFIYYENDLVAKKSYFFLDGEVVCLGAGIKSTMNSPVATTVEHRRLVKPEGEVISVNGKQISKDECTVSGDTSYAYIEGFAGYVFPNGAEVSVSRYKRTQSTQKDDYFTPSDNPLGMYAEINIAHGVNPDNATYAYVILPYASEEATCAYATSPAVEIISNTPECQALRKPSAGVLSVAFYEPGECEGILTDTPIIAMLGERDGITTFSVCEPTQLLSEGNILLRGSWEIVSAMSELEVSTTDEGVKIHADFSDLAGKNLLLELKKI